MRHRLRITAALLGVATIALAACGSDNSASSSSTTARGATTTAGSSASTSAGAATSASGGGSSSVTVGSANFPENVLLAEIYAQALEAKGVKVNRKLNLGSREIVFPALQKGDLSLVPEYTNSLLTYVLKAKSQTPSATNVQQQVDALKSNLPDSLTVLNASTAEDKDVIVCNSQTESQYGFKTLSDLAAKAGNIVLGGPPEFQTRGGLGLKGLQSSYGATFKSFKALDEAGPVTVAALKDNTVNCADIFSTDPSISSNNFTSLTDDKNIVPNEAVLPLIDKNDASNSTVANALNAVSAKLDTPGLLALVAKVVTDKADPAQVAKGWLSQNGLSS
jgi:osmoprotectant transport system substrate-binding protein